MLRVVLTVTDGVESDADVDDVMSSGPEARAPTALQARRAAPTQAKTLFTNLRQRRRVEASRRRSVASSVRRRS